MLFAKATNANRPSLFERLGRLLPISLQHKECLGECIVVCAFWVRLLLLWSVCAPVCVEYVRACACLRASVLLSQQ